MYPVNLRVATTSVLSTFLSFCLSVRLFISLSDSQKSFSPSLIRSLISMMFSHMRATWSLHITCVCICRCLASMFFWIFPFARGSLYVIPMMHRMCGIGNSAIHSCVLSSCLFFLPSLLFHLSLHFSWLFLRGQMIVGRGHTTSLCPSCLSHVPTVANVFVSNMVFVQYEQDRPKTGNLFCTSAERIHISDAHREMDTTKECTGLALELTLHMIFNLLLSMQSWLLYQVRNSRVR